MDNQIFEVNVCHGTSFDWQMAVLFTFDNWEETQKFIELSLKNSLIVQVVTSEITED